MALVNSRIGTDSSDSPRPDQIQPSGQCGQLEHHAHRRHEQHQCHQRQADQRGLIHAAVREYADLEQACVGAHIERLEHLRKCQHHEGQRLAAGKRTGDASGPARTRRASATANRRPCSAMRSPKPPAKMLSLRFLGLRSITSGSTASTPMRNGGQASPSPG